MTVGSMPAISRRRLAVALALVASSAVLAGCGVSATLDPVASAATKSENAGAADMTFSATISTPSLAGGKTVTMKGSGIVAAGQSELTLDMSQLLQQAGAPAGTDATAKEIFLDEGGDYVLYMQMGLLGQLPGGKHWLKIDLSKVGQKLGVDFSKLVGGQAAQDPAQMLSMLRATSGKVDDLGTETIDGTTTTHYRATVDLAKAAKLKGVSSQALQKLTGNGAPSTIPEDVWVGSDGLVRQLRISFATTTDGVPLHLAMTMDLSNYGTAATITAPPSTDVFDMSDLAARGIGQS